MTTGKTIRESQVSGSSHRAASPALPSSWLVLCPAFGRWLLVLGATGVALLAVVIGGAVSGSNSGANGTGLDDNNMLSSSLWNPRRLDYGRFETVQTLQPGRLLVATHPELGTSPVFVKLATATDNGREHGFDGLGSLDDARKAAMLAADQAALAHETAMYRKLHGTGITPAFLGYVVEAVEQDALRTGRPSIVGFATEYIRPWPPTTVNSTSIPTKQGCLAVLQQLHRLGIAHGDAHDGNCLVRGPADGGAQGDGEDGKDGKDSEKSKDDAGDAVPVAVLVDFELAAETWSASEFSRDLEIMQRCLQALA